MKDIDFRPTFFSVCCGNLIQKCNQKKNPAPGGGGGGVYSLECSVGCSKHCFALRLETKYVGIHCTPKNFVPFDTPKLEIVFLRKLTNGIPLVFAD